LGVWSSDLLIRGQFVEDKPFGHCCVGIMVVHPSRQIPNKSLEILNVTNSEKSIA
jgi:hypothetical protein